VALRLKCLAPFPFPYENTRHWIEGLP
jgi:hypothetical protein